MGIVEDLQQLVAVALGDIGVGILLASPAGPPADDFVGEHLAVEHAQAVLLAQVVHLDDGFF